MSGGLGFEIGAVYAVVAVHADGDEGVAAMLQGSTWVPLLAADPARLASIVEAARVLARRHGQKLRVVKFSTRELVETIHPDGRRERAG